MFVGKRQAAVSATDLPEGAVDDLVERALAMASVAPEDPFAGLADASLLAREVPIFDLDADDEPAPERIMAMAAEAEDAARAVDGVTNSEGAMVSWSRGASAMVASNGFSGVWTGTMSQLAVAAIAGEGLGKETDHAYRLARHLRDLPSPAGIGAEAGQRTVRKLGPAKMQTRAMPVVFENRMAGSLLGHLAGAISGPAIARGTSFLKDRLGERVFAPGVEICEDPHRQRGVRSRPFDGEGLPTAPRKLVDDGVLATWLLECRSARQLGLAPTGHATRGISGQPSPGTANIWLGPGTLTAREMIAEIDEGLYVTSLIGSGVNGITGDYSRGASGFRIENGELVHPVSEVTVAGNLTDMYANLAPASDLAFLFGTDSPCVRIDGMTVAGN